MSTKEFWQEVKFPLFSFIVWRVTLFLFLLLAVKFLPLQKNFLGGGMGNYLKAPWFWAWSNFDGEHYISIAQRGYGFAEQAFFPLYPLLIKTIIQLFNKDLTTFTLVAFIISNFSFLVTLLGLYKLIKLDYKEKVARLSIILLLLFPTSFYFGSVYTESLFLAFVIWSFYFARKNKLLYAGFLGFFAALTRTIGIILFPVLIIELFKNRQSSYRSLKTIYLLLIPLGLLTYMFYLNQTTGDPLKFIHTLPSFGEQRSTTLILLPQVFYRYIFKIIPNLNFSYFPIVFTTLLEFITAIFFSAALVIGFIKLKLSYSLYLILGLLVPAFSGSFSSLPRYVLVLFPAFVLMALYFRKAPRFFKYLVFSIMFVILFITTSLFVRGYWIS